MMENLFNGDLRRVDRVEHRCMSASCCSSRAETLRKIKVFVPKLLKGLSLRTLDTDDWSEWDSAMNLPGLLAHSHAMLQRALVRLFAHELAPSVLLPDTDVGQVAGGGGPLIDADDTGSPTGELAREVRVAKAFWSRSDCARQVYLCQACLAPQARMMRSFLQSTSVTWDYQQMMQMTTGRAPQERNPRI